MLYKVLGANTKDYPSNDYYYAKGKINNYYERKDNGFEIYLLSEGMKKIFTLSMKEAFRKEIKGILAHGIGDSEWFFSLEIEGIWDTYGIYNIQESNKEVLKNMKLEVKDKSNDLIFINEGGDINNHLFTCIKYGHEDTYYYTGIVHLNWDAWVEN